jgi:hypothetical protein
MLDVVPADVAATKTRMPAIDPYRLDCEFLVSPAVMRRLLGFDQSRGRGAEVTLSARSQRFSTIFARAVSAPGSARCNVGRGIRYVR